MGGSLDANEILFKFRNRGYPVMNEWFYPTQCEGKLIWIVVQDAIREAIVKGIFDAHQVVAARFSKHDIRFTDQISSKSMEVFALANLCDLNALTSRPVLIVVPYLWVTTGQRG